MREIKLRVQVLRPLASVARGALPLVGGYVGVSLQERRATMQVMLGVSLRARWDATLVITLSLHSGRWYFLLLVASARPLVTPAIGVRFPDQAHGIIRCLSDETRKAVGPFYLVSMPG